MSTTSKELALPNYMKDVAVLDKPLPEQLKTNQFYNLSLGSKITDAIKKQRKLPPSFISKRISVTVPHKIGEDTVTPVSLFTADEADYLRKNYSFVELAAVRFDFGSTVPQKTAGHFSAALLDTRMLVPEEAHVASFVTPAANSSAVGVVNPCYAISTHEDIARTWEVVTHDLGVRMRKGSSPFTLVITFLAAATQTRQTPSRFAELCNHVETTGECDLQALAEAVADEGSIQPANSLHEAILTHLAKRPEHLLLEAGHGLRPSTDTQPQPLAAPMVKRPLSPPKRTHQGLGASFAPGGLLDRSWSHRGPIAPPGAGDRLQLA